MLEVVSKCWTSLPFLLKAEPLRLRLDVTRLSRRWSSLDDDDELELDDDDELDELERDPDDELLSDELKKWKQHLLYDFVVVVVSSKHRTYLCGYVWFQYENIYTIFSSYLPLELETEPRRFLLRSLALFLDLSLSLDFTEDGDSDRILFALK